MPFNIPLNAFNDIIAFAKARNISKVTLFGSRARGEHFEQSDIDLAVSGGDFLGFYFDVTERLNSLLMLKFRNILVHIYNEDDADELLALIKSSFIPAFETLRNTLEEKIKRTP